MRVLVDARLLFGGGIGRYLREITALWLQEPEVGEIRFLGDPRELHRWLLDLPGTEKARVLAWHDPVYSPRAQARWALRHRGWTRGCDACFFPHWDAPVLGSEPPRLLTVHDLTHFLEPEGFPWWKRTAGRYLLRRVMSSAAGVVTVSEATRADLVRWFPDAGARARVIPNGVSHDIFRPLTEEERSDAQDRWGRYRPYLVFVGPLKHHKGAATALRILKGILAARPDVRLLQAGPPELLDPEVGTLLGDRELAARFFQVGVLEDGQLKELYGLGECLLHPALKEGFGLPPLEAMAVGTPVLASDRSSLPEVVATGGHLLDPDDPEAWIRTVLELMGNPEARREAVGRGLERAEAFSWERTARETLTALREVGVAGSLSSRIGS